MGKNIKYSHKIRFPEKSGNLFYDYKHQKHFFIPKKMFYGYIYTSNKNLRLISNSYSLPITQKNKK
jgi:hypothetical protein